MLKKVNSQELIGKTIKSVGTDAVNVVHLNFTDGTSISLWAESGGGTYSIPHVLSDGLEESK